MSIKMPKQVFIRELQHDNNLLDRAMISEDGRLIMSGKVVIQLNVDLDEVANIGCFIFEKDNSLINYRFVSLLEEEQRLEISNLMR